MEAVVQEKHQVLGFVDENPVHNISIQQAVDPSMHLADFQDASLTDFFERPVRIQTGLWNVGSALKFEFNPWLDYFSTPSVMKKLDNYHMMRANLHIKIMINGTPFHYSRLLCAYTPLPLFNDNHDLSLAGTPRQVLMKASMHPHGFVDPSVQSPLEMCFPFICPQNYITCAEMVAQATALTQLGKVTCYSTADLEAVSATAAPALSYTVLAWASEVELVIPTSTIVSASKKRKKSVSAAYKGSKSDTVFSRAKSAASQKVSALSQLSVPSDEKKDGLISSVSSVVANVAGKLTDVPMIGDAAKFTKGIANGVTSLARFFGYSRPPVFTDSSYVKQLPFTSTALTQGNETVSKLSFDPKQSVTIDPAVSAMGNEDELQLSMFTNKETLIETFPWGSASTVDTLLYWNDVSPFDTQFNNSGGGNLTFQASSMCFAAQPFEYWSGSIIYRFQFVASAYHTGRIRITFEPNGAAYDPDSFNTAYSQIVDLATGTDVSFVVPWSQTVPYKKVSHFTNADVSWPIDAYLAAFNNGRIYISVLNELISPDDVKGITVNVFVRGADDLELAVPSTDWQNQLVTGDRVRLNLSASGVGNKSLVPDKLTMLFGEPLQAEEIGQKSSVFFGEVVTNFRPLLKRYEYVGTRYGSTDSSYNDCVTHKIAGMIYPPVYGLVRTPGTSIPTYSLASDGFLDYGYNWNPTSLMSYLGAAFLGTRGSVRWKFVPSAPSSVPTSISASRYATGLGALDNTSDLFAQISIGIEPTTILAPLANGRRTRETESLWQGTVVYPGLDGQPGLEIEIPWYNPLRFSTTDTNGLGTYNEDVGDDHTNSQWMVTAYCQPSTDASLNANLSIDTYFAVGEDFTFNFYLGPPQMYYLGGWIPA